MRCFKKLYIAIVALLMPIPCFAYTAPTYGMSSLIYMSTDIAVVSFDKPDAGKQSATVVTPLYGSLKPGDKIPDLQDELAGYYPVPKENQKAILFLDTRPQEIYEVRTELKQPPYVIVQSGMYLIDDEEHVRRYVFIYDQGNVAVGYTSPWARSEREVAFERPCWTCFKEWGEYVAYTYDYYFGETADEKQRQEEAEEAFIKSLPKLPEMEERLQKEIATVSSIRPLLDAKPDPKNAHALFTLLKSREEKYHEENMYRGVDMIKERIGEILTAIRDRKLLLEAYPYLQHSMQFFESFVTPIGKETFEQADNEGIRFLLSALSSRKEENSKRMSAANVIFALSQRGDRIESEQDKSDDLTVNSLTAKYAEEIHRRGGKIFADDTENDMLRVACIQLLNLKQSTVRDNMVDIYQKSTSAELRFAIEKELLNISDAEYSRLHAPGGPVISIVRSHPTLGPEIYADNNKIIFWVEYDSLSTFDDDFYETSPSGDLISDSKSYFLLENTKTHEKQQAKSMWVLSSTTIEEYTELDRLTNLQPGTYELSYEFSKNGKVISKGYPLVIKVSASPKGNIVIDPNQSL